MKLPAEKAGLAGHVPVTGGPWGGQDMFCTHCGASNKEDAKFCVNCGDSMSEAEGKEKLLRPRGFKDISFVKNMDFLQGLFDFSFTKFVTSKLVHFFYGLSILFAGLLALLLIIFGFNTSTAFGIFALLIGAPLIFLLVVISSRVFLELLIILFRMADQKTKRGEKPESGESIKWNV